MPFGIVDMRQGFINSGAAFGAGAGRQVLLKGEVEKDVALCSAQPCQYSGSVENFLQIGLASEQF